MVFKIAGTQTTGTSHERKARSRQMIVTLGYMFVHIQPIFPTILFAKDPFNIRYWPIRLKDLLPEDNMIQYIPVIFGGFLDIVFSVFIVFPVAFIVAMLIIYFAKLKHWLEVTQSNISTWGPSKVSLRKYQVIQLINQYGFCSLSSAILPVVYTFSHVFTTVIFTALAKGGTERSAEMQLNFLGTLCIIIVTINALIKGAGEIVSKSQQVKSEFKKHAIKRDIRMSLMACRDIRIYFSSVFFLEKGTFTVFINSVIDSTITFVLAS